MRKIFLLTALALIATAHTADACGPRAQRRAARVEARQARCQPVRGTVKAVASVPAKVVQSRPVAVFAATVSRCAGGVCK